MSIEIDLFHNGNVQRLSGQIVVVVKCHYGQPVIARRDIVVDDWPG